MRMVREPTQRLSKNKRLQKEFAMAACTIPLVGVNRCGLSRKGWLLSNVGSHSYFGIKREPGMGGYPGPLYENIVIFV